MNRKWRVLLTCCVILWLSASTVAQTLLPEPRVHALVSQGINLTWRQKYVEADSVFRLLIHEFPGHPAGYIYRAGLMQTEVIDYEGELDVSPFDSLIEVGKSKAQALIGNGGDSKWGYFYLGTAEGYDSYARVYRGDWVGGLLRGLASISALKDAIKLDSALYDAYAGIGTFYYWRSRKTEGLNWLPFVGDDRPTAIAYLEKTIEHGQYNRHTALSALITMLTDAGSYERALEYVKIGLAAYPSNRTFLWEQATAVEKRGKSVETATAYKALLRSILDGEGNNYYNEIVCRLNLAKAEMDLADSAEVRENVKVILRFHESDFAAHLRRRAQDKLEQAGLLLKKLNDGHRSGG